MSDRIKVFAPVVGAANMKHELTTECKYNADNSTLSSVALVWFPTFGGRYRAVTTDGRSISKDSAALYNPNVLSSILRRHKVNQCFYAC